MQSNACPTANHPTRRRPVPGSPRGPQLDTPACILLIDDDAPTLRALSASLSPLFTVQRARSFREGAAWLRSERVWRAVITDLDLGDEHGRTGIDLLELARFEAPVALRVLISASCPELLEPAELVFSKPWPPDLPQRILAAMARKSTGERRD